MTTFNDVLEQADSMSREEREELIRILQARLREERRAQILADVKEAQATQPGNVNQRRRPKSCAGFGIENRFFFCTKRTTTCINQRLVIR